MTMLKAVIRVLQRVAEGGEDNNMTGGLAWGDLFARSQERLFEFLCLVSYFLVCSFESWRVRGTQPAVAQECRGCAEE